MSQYLSDLNKRSSGNVKVAFDLSKYATKADREVAIGIDTFTLA